MADPTKMPETEDGTILYNLDPIIIKHHYEIDYIHSYAQDSPFFAGLAEKKLLGTRCPECGYRHGTPRVHCIMCGAECEWFELPQEGTVHTWTTCHFGSEEFLDETPFHLILVEFPRFKRLSKFKPTDVYFVPA